MEDQKEKTKRRRGGGNARGSSGVTPGIRPNARAGRPNLEKMLTRLLVELCA